jgi:hypothetical protein
MKIEFLNLVRAGVLVYQMSFVTYCSSIYALISGCSFGQLEK